MKRSSNALRGIICLKISLMIVGILSAQVLAEPTCKVYSSDITQHTLGKRVFQEGGCSGSYYVKGSNEFLGDDFELRVYLFTTDGVNFSTENCFSTVCREYTATNYEHYSENRASLSCHSATCTITPKNPESTAENRLYEELIGADPDETTTMFTYDDGESYHFGSCTPNPCQGITATGNIHLDIGRIEQLCSCECWYQLKGTGVEYQADMNQLVTLYTNDFGKTYYLDGCPETE